MSDHHHNGPVQSCRDNVTSSSSTTAGVAGTAPEAADAVFARMWADIAQLDVLFVGPDGKLGYPWLTVAIDSVTGSVVGCSVSMSRPGPDALVVGLFDGQHSAGPPIPLDPASSRLPRGGRIATAGHEGCQSSGAAGALPEAAPVVQQHGVAPMGLGSVARKGWVERVVRHPTVTIGSTAPPRATDDPHPVLANVQDLQDLAAAALRALQATERN